MIFVLLYFIFHLRSVFLATYSVLLIIFSFAVTQLLYREVLGIKFFATLHNLVIFIVLGISADNVFVLFDAWKQSANIPEYEGSIRKRMAYSWKRAAGALLVTTSTTCVAFLANVGSKIMPIQAFGIYAAIVIPVNYLLIVFLLPPMLQFYDKYLKDRLCCIKCKKSRREKYKAGQEFEVRDSCCDRFFGGPWNSFVRKLRWLIVLLAFGWTGYAVYVAQDVSPLTEPEQFFRDDHPVIVMGDILKHNFDSDF